MEGIMSRLTAVALALAATLGACRGAEHRAARGETAAGNIAQRGAEGAETTAAAAKGAVAGAMDTMGRKMDTAAGRMKSQTETAGGEVQSRMDTAAGQAKSHLDTAAGQAKSKLDTAAGEVAGKAGAAAGAVKGAASSTAIRTKLTSLSKDQVTQLQTALTNDGCNAGTADGLVGQKTVTAVQCGLQKHNISGTDLDALYKALNLNFGS
jgi:hypothetical protein